MTAAHAKIAETIAFIDGLVACGLPHEQLVGDILAEITARHPGHAAAAEKLMARAPANKITAVVGAFLKGLAKAEKAEAKLTYNRDRNRALRGSDNSSTRTTSATRQQSNPSPAYTSPPQVGVSEPKRVLKSISTYPLPMDFKLSPDGIEFAVSEGWDQRRIDRELGRFRDHYHNSSARKPDWNAMWRLWVTNPLQATQQSLPLRPQVIDGQRKHGSHQHSNGPGGLARVANHYQGNRRTDPS